MNSQDSTVDAQNNLPLWIRRQDPSWQKRFAISMTENGVSMMGRGGRLIRMRKENHEKFDKTAGREEHVLNRLA
ncbi:hypothetical protein SARC_09624 [Sphaeroforma arctica JP610]|uniref:Uncharacterized protein n=1 Tax=Sphaeroforma arctica JP610 TaxID=667725 RepID=A0A0L0FMC6_9EUKA|nr:hypothetical protein SARC_09624 [Sphaeroforma arctica JP610]KNC77929.1 hypothetical protein SARC_09624 [Sphaeroforma arctica JP610]|eukprot:XP_014151831.1 hypothetical protein SARC_09624 [Sphaeroforma arctica JP610]